MNINFAIGGVMKKNLTVLLLIVAMVFTFAACGGSGSESSVDSASLVPVAIEETTTKDAVVEEPEVEVALPSFKISGSYEKAGGIFTATIESGHDWDNLSNEDKERFARKIIDNCISQAILNDQIDSVRSGLEGEAKVEGGVTACTFTSDSSSANVLVTMFKGNVIDYTYNYVDALKQLDA
jgi:hypothetical protein